MCLLRPLGRRGKTAAWEFIAIPKSSYPCFLYFLSFRLLQGIPCFLERRTAPTLRNKKKESAKMRFIESHLWALALKNTVFFYSVFLSPGMVQKPLHFWPVAFSAGSGGAFQSLFWLVVVLASLHRQGKSVEPKVRLQRYRLQPVLLS